MIRIDHMRTLYWTSCSRAFSTSLRIRQRLASGLPVVYTAEVEDALRSNRPLIAFETTIATRMAVRDATCV